MSKENGEMQAMWDLGIFGPNATAKDFMTAKAKRTADDVIAEIAEEEKAERLSELESAVIEAAIAYFKSQHDWTESGIVAPFADLYDALWCATDELIKSRSEATGVLKDDVVSEDRERVPREDETPTADMNTVQEDRL